jgi:2-polyprenyl-3-methyl-5-hydroxy-6-metoxy-1,4-benzoquinol methylase
MGIVGGTLGYRILRRIGKQGADERMDGSAYTGRSKLEALLGAGLWTEIKDRVVVDFGCGPGTDAVEMAQRGARHVIGIDIQERFLRLADEHAEQAGV